LSFDFKNTLRSPVDLNLDLVEAEFKEIAALFDLERKR